MYRSAFRTTKPRRDSERAIKLELAFLVSQITRLQTQFCVLCGENNWSRLEAGHFWHRAMPPTEFDLTNLSTLCHACNAAHEYNPRPYRDYMLLTLGEREYHDLAERAHSQTKIGYVALTELREQLRATLAEIKEAAA